MPPQTEDMEAFFKNVEKLEGLPGDFEHEEGSVGDFESFFEKLSSLEDMNWSNQRTPAAPTTPTAKKSARVVSRPGHGGVPESALPPKESGHGQFTTWNQEMDSGSAHASSAPHAPGFVARSLSMSRFLLLAIMLFCTGLAAGFFALSIPEGNRAKLAGIEPLTPKITKFTPTETPTGNTAIGSLVKDDIWPDAEETQTAHQGLTVTENGAVKARLTGPRTPTPQTKPVGEPLPADAIKPRPIVNANQQAGAPTSQARFALQVGACQSAECVAQYQAILGKHVDPKSILVVVKAGKSGQEPIRRIRIEPLNRADALTLRGKLAASDPRFGRAYLVNRR